MYENNILWQARYFQMEHQLSIISHMIGSACKLHVKLYAWFWMKMNSVWRAYCRRGKLIFLWNHKYLSFDSSYKIFVWSDKTKLKMVWFGAEIIWACVGIFALDFWHLSHSQILYKRGIHQIESICFHLTKKYAYNNCDIIISSD